MATNKVISLLWAMTHSLQINIFIICHFQSIQVQSPIACNRLGPIYNVYPHICRMETNPHEMLSHFITISLFLDKNVAFKADLADMAE